MDDRFTHFKTFPIANIAHRTEGKITDEQVESEIVYKSVSPIKVVHRQKPLFMEGSIGVDKAINFYSAFPEMLEVGCYRLRPGLVFGKGLIGTINGIIFTSPDLIIFEENLVGKLWRSPFQKTEDGGYLRPETREMLTISEPSVLLMKGADHIYGHWIVDILPRIAVLRRCGFYNIKYIISKNTPTFGKELLRLAGIPQESLIEVDDENQDIYCQDLIVPSVCRYRSVMSAIALDIYDAMVKTALIESSEKIYSQENPRIYLSRKKWGNVSRRMVNSYEVEECATRNGFEIIYPEELTLVEQIQLFQQVRCVIGEGGSALHNTVFGQSDIRVCVLQGNNNGNFIQSAIGDLRNQKTGYLFGDSFYRPRNGITGDFLIPIPQLNHILNKYIC